MDRLRIGCKLFVFVCLSLRQAQKRALCLPMTNGIKITPFLSNHFVAPLHRPAYCAPARTRLETGSRSKWLLKLSSRLESLRLLHGRVNLFNASSHSAGSGRRRLPARRLQQKRASWLSLEAPGNAFTTRTRPMQQDRRSKMRTSVAYAPLFEAADERRDVYGGRPLAPAAAHCCASPEVACLSLGQATRP